MQQRKYLTVERNAYKQAPRASYQSSSNRDPYDSYDSLHRYGSNTNILKRPLDRQEPKMKFSELHKSPSESNFKTRQQHLKGNIARRRGEGMVSNLKSQLQNLKMQVSKLMSKETDNRSSSFSKRVNVRTDEDDMDSQNVSLSGYGKQISDTISVTSEKIIDQPLRRLQSKFGSSNYDHAHYLELENDLLKTQLRNLKNKYNATKQELREKCESLQKKNQYLQISLRRSQQALTQCKKTLQVELQTIKFQLTRKLQQQYEQDQKKSERSIQPVRDNLGDNQYVQQKITKLYEQLAEKSKLISSMNMDLNQVQGTLEKKSFELKKEVEKNSELSKQFQFSKRQNIRNKSLLENQVNKKVELARTVESLRQKVDSLTKQLNIHSQISTGSQQLQKKFSQQIRQLRQNQEKLVEQNFELQTQIKKLRQLNDMQEEQIRHLKKTINQFTVQVDQISKNLRSQKQKSMEMQSNYRKMIDQAKQYGEKQLQLLQSEYDKYRESTAQITTHHNQIDDVKSKQNLEIKDKQRQVNKWKAEYKMLKLKYEQQFALESTKKQQIESYYKSYKQYKSQNKILQMRNKVLEQSASNYIEKIQKNQSANLAERVKSLEKINGLSLQNQQLIRQITYQQEQLTELRNIIDMETQRANSQESIRKDIEKKVLDLDIENNEQLMSIIQRMKKRVADQDQKVNKYIKQLKNKDNLIKELKKQVKNVLENQEVQLEKFRAKQIAECIQEIQSQTFASLEDLKVQSKKQIGIQMESNKQLIEQNSKMKGQLTQLKSQILGLKQEVKSISHLYNLKSAQMEQMLEKGQAQATNYSLKLQQMQRIKNQIIRSLQSQIASKNQEIQNSRIQIKKYLTISRSNMDEQNFDQALKTQIQGSKKLRDQLNKKNDQVYRLRDSYAMLKAQFDNLKAESDIAKLKHITDRKNTQIQFDVECQSLRSQVSMEQKKVIALQQKIKIVIDQNKKKDNFIQTYIMGKKLPTNQRQLVAKFMKQFEICLTGKQISEKLQSQSQQLEKMATYNFNLMKQIAEMKQKLLMYEAISIDTSELKQNNINDVDTPKRSLMQSQTYNGVKSFE